MKNQWAEEIDRLRAENESLREACAAIEAEIKGLT